jgi:hypothetical protein
MVQDETDHNSAIHNFVALATPSQLSLSTLPDMTRYNACVPSYLQTLKRLWRQNELSLVVIDNELIVDGSPLGKASISTGWYRH